MTVHYRRLLLLLLTLLMLAVQMAVVAAALTNDQLRSSGKRQTAVITSIARTWLMSDTED